MSAVARRLYDLMPTIYRRRDADVHELAAFFEVLQRAFDEANDDVDSLYDDMFIETCSNEIVPSIAALIGLGPEVALDLRSNRAVVANEIALRRRKGTIGALELVASDVSGWQVSARDVGAEIALNQDIDDVRSSIESFADVGDGPAAQQADSLDETMIVRPSVRREARGPASVEITVWPREWYPIEHAQLTWHEHGAYRFNPFGIDSPIRIGSGQRPNEADHRVARVGVDPAGQSATWSQPTGRIEVAGHPMLIGQIELRDLAKWDRPPPEGDVLAFVDIDRGRLTVSPQTIGRRTDVRADFWYPFGADIGGGAYRSVQGADPLSSPGRVVADLRAKTTRTVGARGDRSTVESALVNPDPDTVVVVDDNAVHDLGRVEIRLGPHNRLVVRAAPGRYSTLVGDLVVRAQHRAEFGFNGFRLHGSITVIGPVDVSVTDCTVWRSGYEPEIDTSRSSGSLIIERSIVGRVRSRSVAVRDSILDGHGLASVEASGRTTAERSTFLGSVTTSSLCATSSLFDRPVSMADRTASAVDRCFVASGSDDPATAQHSCGSGRSQADLISRRFGDPAYAQVSWGDTDLMEGGDNGSEVGAYNRSNRIARLTGLRDRAEEFVPHGYDVRLHVVDDEIVGRQVAERAR